MKAEADSGMLPLTDGASLLKPPPALLHAPPLTALLRVEDCCCELARSIRGERNPEGGGLLLLLDSADGAAVASALLPACGGGTSGWICRLSAEACAEGPAGAGDDEAAAAAPDRAEGRCDMWW